MLLLFWVRHCKVGVISESRNEQLLKKAIMISSYALSHKKICRWQSSRYHGEICIKKNVKRWKKSRSTYDCIAELSVWYSIFSMRHLIICGLCSTVFNYKLCHSSHRNFMPSLFITERIFLYSFYYPRGTWSEEMLYIILNLKCAFAVI